MLLIEMLKNVRIALQIKSQKHKIFKVRGWIYMSEMTYRVKSQGGLPSLCKSLSTDI